MNGKNKLFRLFSVTLGMVMLFSTLTGVALAATGSTGIQEIDPIDDTVRITYDANGGANPPVPVTVNEGARVLLPVQGEMTPPSTGGAFMGWNTKADGTGNTYEAQERYEVGRSNTTLYAVWGGAVDSVTLTFDANGGSGTPPASMSGQENTSVTLPDQGNMSAPSNSVVFTGWNTKADGSGTTYNVNASYNLGASNSILYAIWASVEDVTLTFDMNGGGIEAPEPITKAPNSDATLPWDSTNWRTGDFRFVAWSTKADGSGTTYEEANLKYNMGITDSTLYAIWSDNNISVRFSHENGTGESDYVYKRVGSVGYTLGQGDMVPPGEGMYLQGWRLGGWDGAFYAPGDRYTAEETDMRFLAVWGESTLTFRANGGAHEPGKMNVAPGSTVTLPEQGNMLSPADRPYFAGWNTDPSGLGDAYAPGENFVMPQISEDLYAIWTAEEEVTISFDENGGQNPPAAITVPTNVAITLPTQGAMKAPAGKEHFMGWNTKADGTGMGYPVGAKYVPMADATLYAFWSVTGEPVTLSFTYGDFSNSVHTYTASSTLAIAPSSITALPNTPVTLPGGANHELRISGQGHDAYHTYILTGWSSERSAGWHNVETPQMLENVMVTGSTFVMGDEDETLNGIFTYVSMSDEDCTVLSLFGEGEEATTFRSLRDDVMATSPLGQAMIDFYYEASPAFVSLMQENPLLESIAKAMLGGLYEVLAPELG